VPICTFVFTNVHITSFKAQFVRLSAFKGAENQGPKTLEAIQNRKCGWFYEAHADDFLKVPGSPIAYWISDRARDIFAAGTPLENLSEIKQGLATCNNGLFLRLWHEVDHAKIGFGMVNSKAACHSGFKWFPYNKGGGFRKWYGNNNYLVNWENNGKAIHDYSGLPLTYAGAPVRAKQYYFREGITYGLISSFGFSARRVYQGFVFDVGGSMIFPAIPLAPLHGFLTSKLTTLFINVLNPTLNYQVGDICNLPIIPNVFHNSHLAQLSEQCVLIAKTDWDSFETSWDFQSLPLLQHNATSVRSSQEAVDAACLVRSARMKELEEGNNRLFIEAYGLQDELSPEVPDDQITLYRPDREEDIKRLVSYAIGCMMGRYSVEKPGLVYAHRRNEGFDPTQYLTCPADADGIIPVTEVGWFPNDAAERIVKFIAKAWPSEHLEENLKFIVESIGANKGEQLRETIRRYLAEGFYKDHLQTYKKRPIYWLFSSGKQRAFQCLVYLHRYHEGTLARLRTEYVIPLQGKIAARIEQLASDIRKATSTSHRKKLEKEQDALKKQQVELQAFDEKLRHFADKRISLDLDDGVKVNYGKFGDLLAEVTAVCGKSEDEE
jgi:type II restriction/modification system DNA methylase subunit YeeA